MVSSPSSSPDKPSAEDCRGAEVTKADWCSSLRMPLKIGAAAGIVGISALLFNSSAPQSATPSGPNPAVPALPHVDGVQPAEHDSSVSWKAAEPSPGWHWLAKPHAIAGQIPESNFARVYLVDRPSAEPKWKVSDGELVIEVPRMPDSSYELVLFNPHGERASIPVRTRDTQSIGFFLTALPDVHAIGLQHGPTAELERVAEQTYALATEAGVHVLPPRALNKPYEFTLANVDGGLIRGQDLQGKVVVMYDWATWCMSCHAYMKELFPLVQQYGSAVQFVAIDHDEMSRSQMAREEMKRFPEGTLHTAMFANQSLAPGQNHQLVKEYPGTWWMSRLGVRSAGIPRVVVVSKQGVLRFDDSAPAPATLRRLIDQEVNLPYEANAALKPGDK